MAGLSKDQMTSNQPCISTAKSSSSEEDSTICSECRELDFHGALKLCTAGLLPDRDEEGYVGISIANVGTRFRTRVNGNCPVCRMLSRAILNASHDRKSDTDELRAFSFARYFDAGGSPFSQSSAVVGLCIEESGRSPTISARLDLLSSVDGSLVCYHESNPPSGDAYPVVLPRQFEANTVLKWLDFCKRNRKRLCSKRRVQVPGMKVIDCKARKVIDMPECGLYIALSYVWSPTVAAKDCSTLSRAGAEILPEDLSSTISDAIAVTQKLGYQYLWVDKYCIDQNDIQATREQIFKMDDIYENTELTIIAAAGLDENHGLPGVGRTQRTPQVTTKMGDLHFLFTAKDAQFSVSLSRWNSRGWTYQEGVCSRRCLVFLDHQVYFECQGMNCSESIAWDLDITHTEDKSQSIRDMPPGIWSNARVSSRDDSIDETKQIKLSKDFLKAVMQYAGRDLRYDHDTLNAFSGIMRRFRDVGIHDIWGLPVPDTMEPGQRSRIFVSSLAWDAFFIERGHCRRKPGFPSWSWTGWKTTIRYGSGQFRSAIRAVHFEFDTGHGITSQTEQACLMGGADIHPVEHSSLREQRDVTFEYPPILWLCGCTIPISWFSPVKPGYKVCEYSGEVYGVTALLSMPRANMAKETWRKILKDWKSGTGWHFLYLGFHELINRAHKLLVLKEGNIGVCSREGLLTIKETKESRAEASTYSDVRRLLDGMLNDQCNWKTLKIE